MQVKHRSWKPKNLYVCKQMSFTSMGAQFWSKNDLQAWHQHVKETTEAPKGFQKKSKSRQKGTEDYEIHEKNKHVETLFFKIGNSNFTCTGAQFWPKKNSHAGKTLFLKAEKPVLLWNHELCLHGSSILVTKWAPMHVKHRSWKPENPYFCETVSFTCMGALFWTSGRGQGARKMRRPLSGPPIKPSNSLKEAC